MSLSIKRLAIILFLLSSIGLLIPTSHAQNAFSLAITPTNLLLIARPGTEQRSIITVKNQSDSVQTLAIERFPFVPSADGRVSFVSPSDPRYSDAQKIFPYLRLEEDNKQASEVTLGPKQSKDLMLVVALPTTISTSNHSLSIVLISKGGQDLREIAGKDGSAKDIISASLIQAGVASNVFLSIVNDTPRTEARVDRFEATQTLFAKEAAFSLPITNTSTAFIQPNGVISIKNLFGKPIDTIPLQSIIIPPGTTRNMTSTKAQRAPSEANLIHWKDSFPFGIYTASLQLETDQSNRSKVITKDLSFVLIPYPFLITLLIGPPLFVFFLYRVRARIS